MNGDMERSAFDMQNYLEAVTSVIRLMKQPDSPCKSIEGHNSCYLMFSKHMIMEDVPFSMETALDWLETVRTRVSHYTYSLYRNALFWLEHYLMFGDIHSPFCRSEEFFFCRIGMSESFFRLTYELKENYDAMQPLSSQRLLRCGKRFFSPCNNNGNHGT